MSKSERQQQKKNIIWKWFYINLYVSSLSVAFVHEYWVFLMSWSNVINIGCISFKSSHIFNHLKNWKKNVNISAAPVINRLHWLNAIRLLYWMDIHSQSAIMRNIIFIMEIKGRSFQFLDIWRHCKCIEHAFCRFGYICVHRQMNECWKQIIVTTLINNNNTKPQKEIISFHLTAII